MKSIALIILAAILLGGCASTPPKLSRPDACMILGGRDKTGESDVKISFVKLDGAPIEIDIWGQEASSIETTGGEHFVTVKLTGSKLNMFSVNSIPLTMLPGKTYKFKSEQNKAAFKLSLYEMGSNGEARLVQKWAFVGRPERPIPPPNLFTAPIGDPGQTPRQTPGPRPIRR